MPDEKPIAFEYTFLIDSALKTFRLELDQVTLSLIHEDKRDLQAR